MTGGFIILLSFLCSQIKHTVVRTAQLGELVILGSTTGSAWVAGWLASNLAEQNWVESGFFCGGRA